MKKLRKRPPESTKIAKLMREGMGKNQAVATALSMKRAHRLTPSGGYIRAGKKKSRRRSKKS